MKLKISRPAILARIRRNITSEYGAYGYVHKATDSECRSTFGYNPGGTYTIWHSGNLVSSGSLEDIAAQLNVVHPHEEIEPVTACDSNLR